MGFWSLFPSQHFEMYPAACSILNFQSCWIAMSLSAVLTLQRFIQYFLLPWADPPHTLKAHPMYSTFKAHYTSPSKDLGKCSFLLTELQFTASLKKPQFPGLWGKSCGLNVPRLCFKCMLWNCSGPTYSSQWNHGGKLVMTRDPLISVGTKHNNSSPHWDICL